MSTITSPQATPQAIPPITTAPIKPLATARRRSRPDWIGIAWLAFLIFFILGPISTVLLWAFAVRWTGGSLLPQEFGFKFWEMTFARAEVQKAIPNTFIISISVTILSAVVCLPASYAFARMRFVGRQFLLLSFLLTNAFPRFALYVSIAVVFLRLHLIGTQLGVILIELLNTTLLMIWIPTAAFQGVDHALEEAALDVGASRWQVFLRVTVPLVLPAIGSALLLTFVGTFYEAVAVILIGAPNVLTIPVIMYPLINNTLVTQYGAILSLVLWIPSLVLLFFARRLVRGSYLTAGFGV